MVTLVIGGSGSGKSRYAENYIDSLAVNHKRYYVATMEIYGDEGRERVEKHRRQRDDKGFITIEKTKDISGLLTMLPDEPIDILIECVSNLVANEMFSEVKEVSSAFLRKKIVEDIKALCDKADNTVIVSNNVFGDGLRYEEETVKYMELLALVNQDLALFADAVTEVVAGIPVNIK